MVTRAAPSKAKSLISLAQKQQDYVVQVRRDLHQIPELGWEEVKTLSYIKTEIHRLIPSITHDCEFVELKGGLYVDVNVDPSAKRVLYRADVDGLPIKEKTNLPYSSQHQGIMHACGHDCHSAMLLGFMRALASGFEPKNNLRLVWQRAEETLTVQSGGSKMVEEGVCEGCHRAYGLHVSSPHENGVFFSRYGTMMANAAHLCIEFTCTGGHVMRPNYGSNAVDIATEIQVAMRNFCLQTLEPGSPIIFVPSVSNSGTIFNVMPDHAKLWFSVRNCLEARALHEFIIKLRKKIESIVLSFPDAKLTAFEFHHGFPMVINDDKTTQSTEKALQQCAFTTKQCELLYSGEDFAFYADHCPTSFWMLGVKQGPGYDHHTALFNPDESVLWKGVAFWLALA